MKKTMLVAGISLILVSCVLLVAFQVPMYLGAKESRDIALKIEALLPDRTAGDSLDGAMPVLEVDRTDYVALVEIPAFGLDLPIEDRWDSGALSRFAGSAYEDTLVIGGPDHPEQFGFCDQVDLGASVMVTDMTGGQFRYTVARVDRAKDATAQWLQNAEFDLTLFCRGRYSMEYIAVRCLRNTK